MKNNLKIFFLLCHLTIVTPLFSQDINIKINLENKYWVWRDRLVNDFMVPNIDGSFGRGIIFNRRGSPIYWTYNGTYVKGGFDINDEGFQMGKYLIVLASEWKLLDMSGLPKDQIEREIFYELQTINRLDYFAEYFWNYFWFNYDSYSTGVTNGFMIRDDVFRNFLWKNENYPNINTYNDPFLNFNFNSIENYKYLNQGDYGIMGKYIKQNILLSNSDTNDDGVEPLSVLQEIIRMQRNNGIPNNKGFSAAEAGIWASYPDYPPNAPNNQDIILSYYNVTGPEEYSQDNYIGLLQGLVAVSKLVGTSAHYTDFYGTNTYLAASAKEMIHRIIISIKDNDSFNNDWVIDNPVTNKCVKGVHWTKYLENPNSVSGEYCNPGGSEAGWFSGNFADVHNFYTDYSDISGQIVNGIQPGSSSNYDMSSVLATLTASRSNHYICSNWVDAMSSNDQKEFSYLDLLYCILHGGNSERGFQYYYDLLNNQSCGLDYNPNNMGNNNYNNNLTVMIVHNLLKILQNEPYYYYFHDNFEYNCPIVTINGSTVNVICTPQISNPYIIESTAKIGFYTCQSNIDFGSPCGDAVNLKYVAKRKIELKPGFRVMSGAKFRAQIDHINGCEVLPPTNMSVFTFPPGIDYSNGQSMLLLSSINNEKQQSLAEMESKTIEKNNLNNYKNNKFSISPNPTTGIVNITVENSDENHHLLYIKNSLCKEIYSTDFKGNLNLNLSSYPKGIYLIIITDSGYANPSINKIILI